MVLRRSAIFLTFECLLLHDIIGFCLQIFFLYGDSHHYDQLLSSMLHLCRIRYHINRFYYKKLYERHKPEIEGNEFGQY